MLVCDKLADKTKCSIQSVRDEDIKLAFTTMLNKLIYGKPIYVIQNMNLTLGKPFDDGAHILYVNGEYRDDSDIGRLMHDFNCTSADDMHFSILAEKTRYLKENPKGVSEMCKVMEDLRDESYAEGREEQAKMTAKNLHEQNFSIEQIAKAIGFDIATVEKWLTPKAV